MQREIAKSFIINTLFRKGTKPATLEAIKMNEAPHNRKRKWNVNIQKRDAHIRTKRETSRGKDKERTHST